MTHRRFRVGRRATAVVAARHRRRKRAPIGTTFRYRLSEPARTTLTIQQVQVGYVKKARRRGARRCVPAKRLPRRARRCQIRRIVGKLKRGGRAGRNSIAFSGRIGTRPLHAGRYVAILSAVAPDGQKSKPRKLSFQIVR